MIIVYNLQYCDYWYLTGQAYVGSSCNVWIVPGTWKDD